jgi:hypothetical protein
MNDAPNYILNPIRTYTENSESFGSIFIMLVQFKKFPVMVPKSPKIKVKEFLVRKCLLQRTNHKNSRLKSGEFRSIIHKVKKYFVFHVLMVVDHLKVLAFQPVVTAVHL